MNTPSYSLKSGFLYQSEIIGRKYHTLALFLKFSGRIYDRHTSMPEDVAGMLSETVDGAIASLKAGAATQC